MEIKFLLRSGKIVDNPFQFGKEATNQNIPYYFRLKILQLNDDFIKYVAKYREENNIDIKELRETFYKPFAKELQENLVRLVNYEEELYDALLEKNIDIKELQNILKEEFQNLHFYKEYSKSFNSMPFVELLLFGVIRVVPGKPLIDITREYDESGPSVHIHIRNNVGLTDIIQFVKKNYKSKISPTLNYENVNKKDKFKITKRDLDILRLHTKNRLPKGRLTQEKIGEIVNVQADLPNEAVKSVLRRLRKLSRE